MPTVLITGANRGIGLAFVKSFQTKGYQVIAAVRDVSKMPKLEGVITVKIDSENENDAKEAVETLKKQYGIQKLDLVIANAAQVITWDLIKDLSIDHFDTLYRTNIRGPLILFQAVQPLLSESLVLVNGASSEKLNTVEEGKVTGKFVIISSTQGCISKEWPPHMGAYGITKVAANYLVSHPTAMLLIGQARKIHFEHPELISMSINPGHVDTDMGYQGAAWRGWEKPPMTLEDNMPGMLKAIEEAQKDTTSGRMVNFDGTICDW